MCLMQGTRLTSELDEDCFKNRMVFQDLRETNVVPAVLSFVCCGAFPVELRVRVCLNTSVVLEIGLGLETAF